MDNNPEDPIVNIDRLIAIGNIDLESPDLHAALDGYAREAAKRIGLPVGMVSIVLDNAQYLAGSYGLSGWVVEAEGTPIEWSFCANVVRSGTEYTVENAITDEVHKSNPLVAIDGVRSYAGSPVVSPSGQVLGACCVVGFDAREFTTAELHQLDEIAGEVSDEIARHCAV